VAIDSLITNKYAILGIIEGIHQMCGIAGLISTTETFPKGLEPEKIIRRMIEKIRHRGPEAVRIKEYNNQKCWLANARLRVSDERDIADQPYESKNKRIKLVFNGEIYNSSYLEKILKKTDWVPKSQSDTERLVEIIDAVGIESLHSIDGMFAFCAFNERNKHLYIARDRFGQKPLYYVSGNGIFAFASELSALLELSPWIPMNVSLDSTSQYFSLRYVPAPHTAINPIRKLEPGQYAVITPKGDVSLDRFFSPSKTGTLCSNDLNRSTTEIIHKNPEAAFDLLLSQSVEQTVPQDAAIIVSGGVDSTLVAAYTVELDKKMGVTSSNRRSYTIQLEHQSSDESEWAKFLTGKWGWNHELITLTDRQLINSYLRISERLDEPLGDRSLLPSWSLAQAIQPHNRVAIGGDGGDELFIGYERYLAIAKYLSHHGDKINWAEFYWKHGLPVGDWNGIQAANKRFGINPMSSFLEQMRILQAEYSDSPLEFLQILDLINYLPGSVLTKADRSSMDWGLETRSPLLNSRIAVAALSLKPKHLIKNGNMKIVLRNLLENKVGKIPNQGPKQGFGAAIRSGSELEMFLKDNIQSKLKQLIDSNPDSYIIQWISKFVKGSNKWSQNSIFSLSIWIDWLLRLQKEYPTIKI